LSDPSRNAREPGCLYLVPTLLGATVVTASLPDDVLALVRSLDAFVAESAKTARRFLKSIGYPRPLSQVRIAELNEHTPPASVPALLAPATAGQRLGLLSEAGCPAIADPGALLVAHAHATGLRVVPLVGPSSLLLALMASGCNGQRFCFHGYLPVERGARETAIREVEARSLREGSAQLFIEAPYRNNRLLESLLATCRTDTRLCLATDLTLPSESIATRRVADWRTAPPDLERRPTVFILQGGA
jgi:16S rRNA (cytidine1402-2'-O)-methyltransferase